ncbi:hypothetical protein [Fundidesulfovibrio terrae]|uniref:hypothetical protein n=1 Tax=Fundidesulfovibrio terrae TaxID=2922866 RepID=UPI001FAE89E6|nr:hypothetical protein [Fundidesulfovibrio terrae]
MTGRFDPSLLYAECRRCGAPVVRASDPSEDLLWMGIPPEALDADCLLVYDGCPSCSPDRSDYEPRLIRFSRREDSRHAN